MLGTNVRFLGHPTPARKRIWDGCAILLICATIAACPSAHGQQAQTPPDSETLRRLLAEVEQLQMRVQELEANQSAAKSDSAIASDLLTSAAIPELGADFTKPLAPAGQQPQQPQQSQTPPPSATEPPPSSGDMGGHNMSIPGGPKLNIRGFFDFNFGTGSIANPLIFPSATAGCDICGNPVSPPHSGFQAGEFDLFMTSTLSEHLSFLAEMVFGADNTNLFSIDLERYQLTYHLSDYFAASAGRFHTSIGYYNTAFHHGNWFATAEGRPIMYLFEDSGGVLPVHTVGIAATGLVPKTGRLGLHWVAEMGNGRASDPAVAEPAQNFYTDRNYKAVNIAAYVRPDWLQGLQIGGSFYHDKLAPTGLPRVNQDIESAYLVYITPVWEFMNEGVLLSNHLVGTSVPYRSPMAYTQLSRKFGIFHPYFRYQYVNDHEGDPVNILHGLYYGPSPGIRVDFSDYAAFKLQYNRLAERRLPAANGLNTQVAFTF